ncbi:MAG: hypothetical protein HQ592_06470 [Planctomycetes bacterium]|nr:hypothetical protein [Planctomycetota bacterium]
MSRHTLAVSVTLLAVILTACGPTRGVPPSSEVLELNAALVYVDYQLRFQIKCEHIEAKQLDSGRMEIYARFYNDANKSAECQIQVKFKDDSDKIIDETGWMPFVLARREVTEFRHLSLARNPDKFVLMLRKAR